MVLIHSGRMQPHCVELTRCSGAMSSAAARRAFASLTHGTHAQRSRRCANSASICSSVLPLVSGRVK